MHLQKSTLLANKTIQISGSKSISNRLLILKKLFGSLKIFNLSDSQDTELMQNALNSEEEIIDVHHAGTAMRFLTSYFAIQEGRTTILTGSHRMKQRPIKDLVNALQQLGAEIEYAEKEGFPPLKIFGKKIEKNRVAIPANISSQFITSLMLIGGKLENGLQIELLGEITSRPYIEMTLKILSEIGVSNHFNGNLIEIFPKTENTHHYLSPTIFEIEGDWSSASYYYSLAAIGRKTINLKSFESLSLQGDSVVKEIYWNFFGVDTISDIADSKICLTPTHDYMFPEQIFIDMNHCPDIAQTVCVTAAALKIHFEITGLATLKVKETDRLIALKKELFKIGCETEITENSIKSVKFFEPNYPIFIETYDDHRMAMSFAPYCLIHELIIENEQVVEKSYPNFWKDFNEVIYSENI